MRAVVFTRAGGADVIRLQERPDPAPGPGQVLIATRFAGVNPADVLQREGRFRPPVGAPADIGGWEVAGDVVATGSVQSRWRPGDRVFGIVDAGGFADRVLAFDDHLAAIPEELDDRGAAGTPGVFMTAHDAVRRCALPQNGLLLVTAANGSVGSAAVQIGVALGNRVIASVRSQEVRASVGALGAVVATPEEALSAAVEAGGANGIIELVSAAAIGADLDALSANGIVVVVGVPEGDLASFSVRSLMARRAAVIGSVIRGRSHSEKSALVEAFESEVVPLLALGRVRPRIETVFPAADAAAALERLAQPGRFGRILLSF